MVMLRRIFFFIGLCGLMACSSQHYAPVDNAWSPDTSSSARQYRVQPGDTLYAIAWRYDLDYRELAEANHLSSPYTVEKGQVLTLVIPKSVKKPKPKQPVQRVFVKTTPTTKQKSQKTVVKTTSITTTPSGIIQWRWPAKGRIVATYSPKAGRKGVDIAGQLGEPIYAAASGKVAYCGNGLKGYGNLIIIKHNDEFLSAYAHNQKLLVHEGEQVKMGQMIATMGNTESKKVILHFEIREAGRSVNPLNYVKP